MSDISVIGLGAMGSAIAKAELGAGHAVTVWNRSRDKISPLVDLGASGSETISEAILASEVILICIDCYETSDQLLDDEEVLPCLPGKTFIQFSQGTPTEARSSEAWLSRNGASYLDGTIFCFPSMVGDPQSIILVGGNQSCFERVQKFLNPLGGDVRLLEGNIGASAAVSLGVLSVSVALYMGVAHGAQICISEGAEVGHLASVLYHGPKCKEMAEIIHNSSYELGSLYDGASLNVYNDIVKCILSHANETGSNSELPSFLSKIYQKGVDAGFGDLDRAALVKVLTD
jgi:3-hydroxyisobutyrate dehydrogenase-like beta-hydroxyacid dehydrogenase